MSHLPFVDEYTLFQHLERNSPSGEFVYKNWPPYTDAELSDRARGNVREGLMYLALYHAHVLKDQGGRNAKEHRITSDNVAGAHSRDSTTLLRLVNRKCFASLDGSDFGNYLLSSGFVNYMRAYVNESFAEGMPLEQSTHQKPIKQEALSQLQAVK